MTATKVTADEISLVCVEKDNKLSVWVHDHEHNTYELYTLKTGSTPAPVWVSFEGQEGPSAETDGPVDALRVRKSSTRMLSHVHEPGQFATLPDGPWNRGMFLMWARAFATYGMA